MPDVFQLASGDHSDQSGFGVLVVLLRYLPKFKLQSS